MNYVRSLSIRWHVSMDKVEDVQQEVLMRLWAEEQFMPFEDARSLWGRATNIAKETIAAMFASSLPVSGVSFQAHNAARRYLAANDNDPRRAYANQTNTDRVSRELLQVVAGGSVPVSDEAFSSPETLNEASYRLSEHQEYTLMSAVNALPEAEREVVRAYVWGDGERLTLRQVSDKLGFSLSKTRTAWRRARKRLAEELASLM